MIYFLFLSVVTHRNFSGYNYNSTTETGISCYLEVPTTNLANLTAISTCSLDMHALGKLYKTKHKTVTL